MIRFFKDAKKEDIAIVGGKGANLSEMYNLFNIPNGFTVTTKAYNTFVEMHKLKDKISEQLKDFDPGDHKLLEKTSAEIKKLIMDEKLFEELEKEITEALTKLKGDKFAVRSSATAEDLITASFAGQQDSYLNIERKDIIKNVL